MAIYDRKNKNEPDVSKTDDPSKASTTTDTSTEPKIKTDEKDGPDLAALNANGPGTEQARAQAASDDAPDGSLVVAEGRSVTSLRGILGPGTVVTEKDFPGGKERLDELTQAGTLVRKGERPQSSTEPAK